MVREAKDYPMHPWVASTQPSPLLTTATRWAQFCATLLTAGRWHCHEQTQNDQAQGRHGCGQLLGLPPAAGI